jgi:hypothetical protein
VGVGLRGIAFFLNIFDHGDCYGDQTRQIKKILKTIIKMGGGDGGGWSNF